MKNHRNITFIRKVLASTLLLFLVLSVFPKGTFALARDGSVPAEQHCSSSGEKARINGVLLICKKYKAGKYWELARNYSRGSGKTSATRVANRLSTYDSSKYFWSPDYTQITNPQFRGVEGMAIARNNNGVNTCIVFVFSSFTKANNFYWLNFNDGTPTWAGIDNNSSSGLIIRTASKTNQCFKDFIYEVDWRRIS